MSDRRLVEKTRARLNRETGTIYKNHADRLTFALAFPSTYYVGMSNLGFQLVYGLLNEHDEIVCERAFLPDASDLLEIEKTHTTLFTMESQIPVRNFDVFAFSLSYELDYPNVLRMMALSGIPALAEERDLGDFPLVIAGGPAPTFNPETIAPFFDVFVIGEAEVVLPQMLKVMLEHRENGRRDLLLALAHVKGVYVPSFYIPDYNSDGTLAGVMPTCGVPERIHRQRVKSLDPYRATSVILTPETEFSNMILAEVARGCGRQCRFCAAGYTYLPPRARSPHSVIGGIDKIESAETRHRIGLLSASVFDHPSSLLICESLVEKDRLFSISSTRADTLSEQVAEVLHQGGHETLTIAPEAGSDRLRQVINKCISHEDVLRAADVAWDGGFRRLRLYFMVGLPTETEDDIEGIISLVTEVAAMYPWAKISVSAGCFVPKPWTPFQWSAMDGEKPLERKLTRIRTALRPLRRVEVAGESAREAVAQGVLARGDRRLQDALLIRSRGRSSWRGAFREGGVDTRFYTERPRRKEEVLPWDHLDLGVRKEYLWNEFERSMRGAATLPCRVGVCKRCGVCV